MKIPPKTYLLARIHL